MSEPLNRLGHRLPLHTDHRVGRQGPGIDHATPVSAVQNGLEDCTFSRLLAADSPLPDQQAVGAVISPEPDLSLARDPEASGDDDLRGGASAPALEPALEAAIEAAMGSGAATRFEQPWPMVSMDRERLPTDRAGLTAQSIASAQPTVASSNVAIHSVQDAPIESMATRSGSASSAHHAVLGREHEDSVVGDDARVKVGLHSAAPTATPMAARVAVQNGDVTRVRVETHHDRVVLIPPSVALTTLPTGAGVRSLPLPQPPPQPPPQPQPLNAIVSSGPGHGGHALRSDSIAGLQSIVTTRPPPSAMTGIGGTLSPNEGLRAPVRTERVDVPHRDAGPRVMARAAGAVMAAAESGARTASIPVLVEPHTSHERAHERALSASSGRQPTSTDAAEMPIASSVVSDVAAFGMALGETIDRAFGRVGRAGAVLTDAIADPLKRGLVAAPLRILELELNPQEFGPLRVRLAMSAGRLTLDVTTERVDIASLLNVEKAALYDALRNSGYSVETLSISTIEMPKPLVPTSQTDPGSSQLSNHTADRSAENDPGHSGGRRHSESQSPPSQILNDRERAEPKAGEINIHRYAGMYV